MVNAYCILVLDLCSVNAIKPILRLRILVVINLLPYRYTPPHLIDQKSIITAMLEVGVKKIIAFASVGSLKKVLPGNLLCIPN